MSTSHLNRRVTVKCASFSCDNLVQTTIANAGRTQCVSCRREAKRLEDSQRKRRRSINGRKRGRPSRLTAEQVAEMRRLYPDLRVPEIARLFGVSKGYASQIIRGIYPEKFADAA